MSAADPTTAKKMEINEKASSRRLTTSGSLCLARRILSTANVERKKKAVEHVAAIKTGLYFAPTSEM